MRLLLALLVVLAVAPVARAGVPVRIADAGQPSVHRLHSDDQQRVYAVGETGEVRVYTPLGRELARWSAPSSPIVVTPAGDVFAKSGGVVTRYTWDGRAVAAWPPLSSAGARLAALDPRGSLIFADFSNLRREYTRYGFDGTPLGPVPVDAAEVVTANGEIWAWAGSLLGFRGDGRMVAQIGYECGFSKDCRAPGPYGNPSGARLELGPDGALLAVESRRVQAFDGDGRLRYVCDDPIGTEYINSMTAVGNRLIVAGTDGIYRTSLRPGKCVDAPIRIDRIALVHGRRRDVVRVHVTGTFKLGFALRSEREPGRYTAREVKLRPGRHDIAIPGCRRVRTCLGAPPYLLGASGEQGKFYVSTRFISAG